MTFFARHRRLAIFALIVLAQAVVVLALVVREERLLAEGTEITLEVVPVDPRDLLRGDYVTLGYEAQDLANVLGDFATEGETVYVVFQQRGEYWVPIEYNRDRVSPSSLPSGSVQIKARVTSSNLGRIRVDYPNLDRYYIPSGTGNPPSIPDAVVTVTGDGEARLVRLLIDGQPWP
ncbi:MAG: GDYXXLXY domain-containing protein [Dehalococcoidia bacterium]